MFEPRGYSLVGYKVGTRSGSLFLATNPLTGEKSTIVFSDAARVYFIRACDMAQQCAIAFAATPVATRVAFLRKVAANLREAEPLFLRWMPWETALPPERVGSELKRTTAQWELYAAMLEEGAWVDARIETAIPERKPKARPDLRSMNWPLGPVVVFGAGNFPLAYSVPGSDTASALAAGCPVVAKAHPGHPHVCEIAGLAIQQAARELNLPEGVFSMLHGAIPELSHALVTHPAIKAVAFTGSSVVGLELMESVKRRPDPIPFHAEMGGVNPVFVLPGALASRSESIVADLHQSVTSGLGQFCTKPGIIFVPMGDEGDAFVKALAARIVDTPAGVPLSSEHRQRFVLRQEEFARTAGLVCLGHAPAPLQNRAVCVLPSIFETADKTFLETPMLHDEFFGPAMVVVRYASDNFLRRCCGSLAGQLTATLYSDAADMELEQSLAALLERRVGRLVYNMVPTGVEVGDAIVHGGPFPATSGSQFSSVGKTAILRWVRRLCWQNAPEHALPDALKRANPLGILRRVESVLTRDPA